jgi:hypothetical protein
MRARTGKPAARVAAICGCALVLAVAGSAAAGGRSSAPTVTVGTPVTGAMGIQRTTAQLMAARPAAQPKHPYFLEKHDADLHLVPNPASPPATPSGNTDTGLRSPGPKLAVGSTKFTGATFEDSDFVPPDSDGAVGPSQFLVAVNGRIRVLSKTGTTGALDDDLSDFFSSVISADSFATDPRVRYDPLSDKWFVAAIDVNPATQVDNRWMLAVSDSGTITNSTVWTFFEFTAGSGNTTTGTFADFDTLGIDANALYVGANIFNQTPKFVGADGFVIRKSSVTGAGPIVETTFSLEANDLSAGAFSPQGVDNTDPSATVGYFVGTDVTQFGTLDVVQVSNPGGTPSVTNNVIDVPATAFPLSESSKHGVTVTGSSKPLDDIDDRLSSASIQNGKLYAAQNIGVNSSGVAQTSSPSRDGIRWYELSNLSSTPTLSRSGTIFDSSSSNPTSFFIPSIAVSPQGHAVIGMDAGSAVTHPDGAVSSMLSGSSSFSTPTRFTSSSASYNPTFESSDNTVHTYRWGDFSTTTLDPCDEQTFWTIQEYVDNANGSGPNPLDGFNAGWGVEVGKVSAPPPATPASTNPAIVGTGNASVSAVLTGTSSNGSGFWDPGSGSCRIQASVTGGVVVNSVTFTNKTHLTLDLDTTGATTGMHTVTITNPDGQQSSAAVIDVGTAPTNAGAPVVSGTAAIGDQLTTTNGTWNGVPSTFTFTYAWDRCDQDGMNCGAIGGASASTYTLVQADVGHVIEAVVTASNGVSPNASEASNQTAVVTGPPSNAGGVDAPSISFTTTDVGDTLTADDGTWDPGFPADPTFSHQWEDCDSAGGNCTPIVGATGSTYMIAMSDAGFRIRVFVTGTNDSGSSAAVESSNTADVNGPPMNLTAPAITGTAQVGSTLTAHDGSWSGVPAPGFTVQWEVCDSAGANCSDISGQMGATFTPVSGDVGKTIRVKVSASNTNGSAGPAESAQTAAVIAASSGGGGGGGGGGTGGPNVAASLTASATAPNIGDTLTYTLKASIVSGAASDVVATITLPSQVKLDSTYADRGKGCTGTTILTCDLDFLSGSLVATVTITTTVESSGTLVATASLATKPTDPVPANNTASVTVVVAAPPTPTPPLPAPKLHRTAPTGTLHAVRTKTTEHVTAHFSTNEAMRLHMTVTRSGKTKDLLLLSGTRLAGTTLGSRKSAVNASVSSGGHTIVIRLTRGEVVKGKLYVIHLTATNSAGVVTHLTIAFRA